MPGSQAIINDAAIDPSFAPQPSQPSLTSASYPGSQAPFARVPFANMQPPSNSGAPFFPQTPPYPVYHAPATPGMMSLIPGQGIPVGYPAHWEKDNVQPAAHPTTTFSVPTTPTTPGPAGRQPQVSTFGAILEKAKSRIPAKRTIEDRLSDMAS